MFILVPAEMEIGTDPLWDRLMAFIDEMYIHSINGPKRRHFISISLKFSPLTKNRCIKVSGFTYGKIRPFFENVPSISRFKSSACQTTRIVSIMARTTDEMRRISITEASWTISQTPIWNLTVRGHIDNKIFRFLEKWLTCFSARSLKSRNWKEI